MPPGIGYPGMVPVMGPDGTEEYVPEGMLPGTAPNLGQPQLVEPASPWNTQEPLPPGPPPALPPWQFDAASGAPGVQAPSAQPAQQPPWSGSAKVSYSGYGQPQERLP